VVKKDPSSTQRWASYEVVTRNQVMNEELIIQGAGLGQFTNAFLKNKKTQNSTLLNVTKRGEEESGCE
jgi:hypothetical protein